MTSSLIFFSDLNEWLEWKESIQHKLSYVNEELLSDPGEQHYVKQGARPWFVTLQMFLGLISNKNEAILQILDHVQSIFHMIV